MPPSQPPLDPRRLALGLLLAVGVVALLVSRAEDQALGVLGFSTDLASADRPGALVTEADEILVRARQAAREGRLSVVRELAGSLRGLLEEAHEIGGIGRPIAPRGTDPYSRSFRGDRREKSLLELEWTLAEGFALESEEILGELRESCRDPGHQPGSTYPGTRGLHCPLQDTLTTANSWTSCRLRLAQTLRNLGRGEEAMEVARELEEGGRAATPAFFQELARRARGEEPLRRRYSSRRSGSPLAPSPLLALGRTWILWGENARGLILLQEDLEAAREHQPLHSYAVFQRLQALEEAFSGVPPEDPRPRRHREQLASWLARARTLAAGIRSGQSALPEGWDPERWEDDWEQQFRWLEGRFVSREPVSRK